MKVTKESTRSFESIKKHYEIEKELAVRLKSSERENRPSLYTTVYDELFQRVSDHPQLIRKDQQQINMIVQTQATLLRKFSSLDTVFLEIGAGDCKLSIEISQYVKKVYAVDVSKEIVPAKESLPENVTVIISDGISIDVPTCSVDLCYSFQLMEHLHPDDAFEQVKEIYKSLKNNGMYICITPNRLYGPSDVSKYFDDEAQGLHLMEYTYSEISKLFKKAGFQKIKPFIFLKGRSLIIPAFFVLLLEKVLSALSKSQKKKVANFSLVKIILGIYVIASK